MAVDESLDVQREVRIDASPEVVFSFFTDPDQMIRWKGITAELDPRPGGVYRVVMNGRDVARGEYVEVVPYERVVFTWGWEAEGHPIPPGSSTVEVTLVPHGGGTLVRLRHTGLPDDDARAQHGAGWDHYFARLAVVATGGQAGRDPWVDAPPS